MYAVIATPAHPSHGHIVSLHETEEAAQDALAQRSGDIHRSYPDAITHLMNEVCELPTPAGDSGKVGDRVAIDLSRN